MYCAMMIIIIYKYLILSIHVEEAEDSYQCVYIKMMLFIAMLIGHDVL